MHVNASGPQQHYRNAGILGAQLYPVGRVEDGRRAGGSRVRGRNRFPQV